MIKLFVRHQVQDFDAWHAFYKKSAKLRSRFGVRSEAVFCGIEDKHDVTITHDFEKLEAVQQILSSEEMRAALAEAGVVGEPTAWVVEPVAWKAQARTGDRDLSC